MSTKDVVPERKSLHYPLDSEMPEDDMTKELLKPFAYLTSIPGKKVRQDLMEVLGYWVPIDEEKKPIIAELLHYLHNGSLLVDDIQDSSTLRRGTPTAHTIYGIPRTIVAMNCVFSHIWDLMDQLDDYELTKIIMENAGRIIAGQGMELYWRDKHVCPTQEEYVQMIYRKTGVLFECANILVNSCSTGKTIDISKFLKTFGLHFQINDDLQNLQNQIYFDSKGFCEDISEGKCSFPMVHAINNFPKEGKEIMEILRERTYDVDRKRKCLALLEKCGSFEYTKKILEELKGIFQAEISKMDPNPLLDAFIENTFMTCL